MKYKLLLILSFCSLFANVTMAASYRKLLAIGNDNYQHGPTLKNARNDAKSISDAFTRLDYSVTSATDVTLSQMHQAITIFSQSLVPGDTALLYYSGHGFQVDGDNYLVPIDFSAATAEAGKQQGVSLASILDEITKRGATTQVIILDACRDNPFFSSRSTKGGWADAGTSAGTLIVFGTSPGSTASDNPNEPNGLFTQMFLSHLSSELPIEDMLKVVRSETITASFGAQTPWIASSLTGEFYLNPKLEGKTVTSNQLTLREQISRSTTFDPRSIVHRNVDLPADLELTDPTNGDSSADILVRQGLLLAQQGNYSEACRSLSAAVALRPGLSIALRVLGLLFNEMGRSADALAQFTRAINVDPSDHLAYFYRCSASTASDPVSAIRDCEASLGIRPAFVSARLALANALLVAGQGQAALKEINATLELSPGLARAYALRGRLRNAMGQYEAGSKDLRTAIRLATGDQR
jgi:Tfp pilus assembly protein PilF